MSTRGKRFSLLSFLRAMYPTILLVRLKGKRMTISRKQEGARLGLPLNEQGTRIRISQRVSWIFQAVATHLVPRRPGVAGQGHEREIQRVQMVLEVKDLGEARSGELV